MMSYIKAPQELDSLENVIAQYFAKKVDAGMDALCDSGSVTLDTIEGWGNEHRCEICNGLQIHPVPHYDAGGKKLKL